MASDRFPQLFLFNGDDSTALFFFFSSTKNAFYVYFERLSVGRQGQQVSVPERGKVGC